MTEHTVARRALLQGAVLLGTGAALGGVEWLMPGTASAAAPAIIDCASWGAVASTSPVVVESHRPNKILIHHTASANSADLSMAHAIALARSIQNSHLARGWIDSGQHFTVSRGGYILEGRHRSLEVLRTGDRQVVGAHCPGQNDQSIGIENEGLYTSVGPPATLYNKLVTFCAYICQQYAIAPNQIFGHRDFVSTECPGDVFYARLPQLRSDVAAVLGIPDAATWVVVRQGASGERVRTIQYLLRQAGLSVTVDGAFGSGTDSAVRSFQGARGLSVDGVVGPNTWEALVVTVRRDASGEAVKAAQSQLAARGYGISVDGAFGAATDAAVRRFQTDRGLASDGIVGRLTWIQLTQ